MGPMVCGVDGNTYFNECLAVCQGVAIDKRGACPGTMDNIVKDDTYDETGVVDMATMKRFQDEKFKLVAKRIVQVSAMVDENSSVETREDTAIPVETNTKIKAVRMTDDNFEYMADIDPAADGLPVDLLAFIPEVEPVPDENPDGGDDRKLWVFDADNRFELQGSTATVWPNKFSGYLTSGCTGTAIYTDAVLTAAHCVHTGLKCDANGNNCVEGAWLRPNFVPALYRTSADAVVQPWGQWAYKTATTYSIWTNGWKQNPNDTAVVQLHPNSHGSIGSFMGYAGLKQSTVSSMNSCTNCLITTIGYPADKPDFEMWKSPCYAETGYYTAFHSYLLKHYCDTVSGNSGGSFMDKDSYIYAVHSFHTTSSDYYNGAVLVGPHLSNIRTWSGRA